MRFVTDTNGQIKFDSLTRTTGRTAFDVRTSSYTLPELQTTEYTYFSAAEGTTINAPKLITMEHRGTSLWLARNSTFNSATLSLIQGFDVDSTGWSGQISISDGATLNTPNLRTLNNASLSWGPNRTFNHSLVNVDGSEFFVGSGATLDLSGVTNYTNTLSDYRSDTTLLSADGVGSVLDLSGVGTFTSASYGYRNSSTGWNYDVSATNGGVIDLSGVTTVTGANPNASSDNNFNRSFLRFVTDTNGQIKFDSLTRTTGQSRLMFARQATRCRNSKPPSTRTFQRRKERRSMPPVDHDGAPGDKPLVGSQFDIQLRHAVIDPRVRRRQHGLERADQHQRRSDTQHAEPANAQQRVAKLGPQSDV